MSEITGYIGYIGCFFLSIFLIPQVLKTYNTKKTEGLSPLFICISMTANIFMLSYGILIEAYPVVISNGCILANNIMLLSLYLKYRDTRAGEDIITVVV